MTGRVGSVLALLVVVTGCASAPTATVPVTRAADLAAQPPAGNPTPPAPNPVPAAVPRDPEPAPGPAYPPIRENGTFVTINGIPRYKIGVGDVLEILITTGSAQDRQAAVVRGSGTVSAAFLEVEVAGLTTDQAAEEIRRQLAQFYRQVGVEVLVRDFNSKRVTVLGAVSGKVGALPLKGRMTLVDLLAEVGGPAVNADLERVRIARQDGTAVVVNLVRLLDGPLAQAFALDAGDVVFIPTYGAAPGTLIGAAAGPGSGLPGTEARVFVLGEVRSPGAVLLTPNMRLSQALALVGGPTDVAVLENARIIRGGLQKPQVVESNFLRVVEQGDLREDVALQPNDLIVLPRSGIGNWNAFIAKIRPTLEVLTLPLTLPVQIEVLRRR